MREPSKPAGETAIEPQLPRESEAPQETTSPAALQPSDTSSNLAREGEPGNQSESGQRQPALVYALIVLASICIEMAMNLPMGSLPLLLHYEHVSVQNIALAMGAGMAAPIFVSMPIGVLVDRLGRRTMMKIGIVGASLTLLAMGFAHGAIVNAALMALRSASLLSFVTAQATYVSNMVSKQRAASAVTTMGIITSLSMSVAPASAVWLWQHGFGRSQYLWAIAVLMLSGLFVFFLPARYDLKRSNATLKALLIEKPWWPAVVFCLLGASRGGVLFSLAVLTFQTRGLANGAAIFTVFAVTTAILRFPVSRTVERLGVTLPAALFIIINGAGCWLAAGAPDMKTVIVAGILMGIAWALFIPIVLTLLFQSSSENKRGSVMGVFNFSAAIGFTLGSAIAALASSFGDGFSSAIVTAAALPVLALPLVFTAANKHKVIAAQQAIKP